MAGIADMALGAAPIAGGALLGTLAGTFKGPDFRTIIKTDLELLDKLPDDSVEVRRELKRTIDERMFELIATIDQNRELRLTAKSYKGNWRDLVVFVCALLFTLVWWNVPHSRTNWTITFVILVIISVIIGIYAARGVIQVMRRFFRRSTP